MFDTLRKTIMDTIEGCIILFDIFLSSTCYICDVGVEYECMELKCDDDVRKMFFIFSEFNNKSPT